MLLFLKSFGISRGTGTIFAYNAINDPDETDAYTFTESAPYDFWLSFLPETFASTTWYFLPVDYTDLSETDGIVWNVSVDVGDDSGGVFDNNESLKSGEKEIIVGCWDDPLSANFFYSLSQIMSGAQYNAVKGTGGFTDIEFDCDICYGYVYKLQSSTILGKPMNILIYEPQHEAQYSYTK